MSDSEPLRPADDLGRLIDLLESKALPLLERIAVALERTPMVVPADSGVASNGQGRGLVDFRLAMDEARWDHAEAIAQDLALENPDNPKVAALAAELDRTRQFAIDDLRERIEAARQANDPEGAISSRDDLAKILRGEAIKALDQTLVKWLMGLVQRRLRTGTIQVDVVVLAARVAESFGGTIEGASLRASLPTLRRSAGLCPKCAEPYKGIGGACPKCLAASAAPTPPPIVPDDLLEPENSDLEQTNDPIDLNNERFWKSP